MPNAGWCRECGEWVWVDEDGGCQHGHGPECVADVYDATPAAHERGVGEGDMPAEFNTFNWGAFLLPFFWGLAYGVWPVVTLWLVALMTPIVLAIFAGSGGESSLEASLVGITVISEIVSGVIRLYIGSSANRLFWTREQLRLQVVEDSLPRVSMNRFLGRQRIWIIVGWVFMAASIAGVAVIALLGGESGTALRDQLGVTQIDAGLSIVWLLAEVLLGVWLAWKMRQDLPAGPPNPAKDVV